jgi:hypothetical protein
MCFTFTRSLADADHRTSGRIWQGRLDRPYGAVFLGLLAARPGEPDFPFLQRPPARLEARGRGRWLEAGASGSRGCWGGGWHDDRNSRRSGNVAFDEYRRETLRRLEEEQKEFVEYLDRLRAAKDKSEFDQFMSERRNGPAPA